MEKMEMIKNGKKIANGKGKKVPIVMGNGQQQMSSKITNDSLMSQCTAMTTVSNQQQQQQQQQQADMDMEFMDGEKVTVIDPLLKQQWTGTLNK